MIVATAGHIDHGKTELVKALTGIDTDRLPEEKARGLSIDIGFAYHELGDGTVTGFVDVPGHERFIRNMLAGVAGIDYALLVVAADDGPMPQTEEHLAILDLLGVDQGCVALTKTDRVPSARVEEAIREVRALLAGTSLGRAEIFPVSAVAGAGIDALRAHLREAAKTVRKRPVGGNFRLAIDRCFTLQGTGLVVTGTVFAGRVVVGDRLVLSPIGREVRVRGLHAQGRAAERGTVGQRCALNLAGGGVNRAHVRRGDWVVASRAHAPTRRVDARIRVLRSEVRPLAHWTPVHLHLGAADVTGRVAVLEDRTVAPGRSALVQLVLDQPVGALWGDRLVLRDQSARRTIAGGSVVDPFPPARGRKRPARLAALAAMEENDPAAALAGLLELHPSGLMLDPFARARNLSSAEAEALWRKVEMVRTGRAEAPVALAVRHWSALREATLAALEDWHADHPNDPGPEEERLRRTLPRRVQREVFGALVIELVRDGRVVRDGTHLRLPAHRPAMTPQESALWERVRPLLEEGGLRPPRVRELAADLGVEPAAMERFLVRAAKLGLVVRVAPNRFYAPDPLVELAVLAESLAAESADGMFSAAAYRDRTGIGRNLAIQVLEHFDRIGFTVRVGDSRRLRRSVADAFPESRSRHSSQ